MGEPQHAEGLHSIPVHHTVRLTNYCHSNGLRKHCSRATKKRIRDRMSKKATVGRDQEDSAHARSGNGTVRSLHVAEQCHVDVAGLWTG